MLLLNVEDILGFAQLKADKFIKIIKRFNINRAIHDIISIQQYQAESKGIELKTEFYGFPSRDGRFMQDLDTAQMNFFVNSDEKRIKQVLMNLQSNALKFTRPGGEIRIIADYIQA